MEWVTRMSSIYFAKMNINEQIYEVYREEKNITDLLRTIAESISHNVSISMEDGSELRLFNVDQSESLMQISGFLGDIRTEERATFDVEHQTAIDQAVENALEYVTFFFDIEQEILAFTTSVKLSRKKILNFFENVIKEKSDIGVAFMMYTDIEDFSYKIKSMEKVTTAQFKLVPPNGDKEDFEALYKIAPKFLEETEATNFKQEFSTRKKAGINLESNLMESYIEGVGLGYAQVTMKGKDDSGESVEVKSESDSPLKVIVSTALSHSKPAIKEQAMEMFSTIRVKSAAARERLKRK
ncbi:DUF4747 family protein [Weissella cibaria]|uniref:DUF4747 family protein n=3 Tax=Weissella cibaria TaxID=137591 RepID=A0A9Q8JHH9_9LACO|nr:DUF4747 family protein [Weissella cibaria]TVV40437.1 DUF4747 family protein [Weissella cibaria]